MDAATVNSHISIIDENGQIIDGVIRLMHQESVVLFEPHTNWSSGNYKIRIGAKSEDLAGNNLNRLFDRDLDPKQKSGNAEFYWLEFKI